MIVQQYSGNNNENYKICTHNRAGRAFQGPFEVKDLVTLTNT